jgi:hypothetical protein
MTCPDCHPAFVAGLEQGRMERFKAEVTDAVQAVLHQRVLESLGMAKRSARHGEAFSAMVIESGGRE